MKTKSELKFIKSHYPNVTKIVNSKPLPYEAFTKQRESSENIMIRLSQKNVKIPTEYLDGLTPAQKRVALWVLEMEPAGLKRLPARDWLKYYMIGKVALNKFIEKGWVSDR